MARYILPFSSREATLAQAGGKGANLSELARAGFAVPPGFIITTDAYRAFVQTNELQPRILALVHTVSPDDPAALETASAEIRTLFERGALPDEIAAEIRAAYHELITQPSTTQPFNYSTIQLPLAIRSSATAEDLPGLSFAGQQDTYLNIVGEDPVLGAVKKCWGSLWTGRAIGYRARNLIPPEEVALAVVVQAMVASEASGILFTANPLTGRRDETVVDASFGLGEAIVSGQVNPDHYVVHPGDWQITRRTLGDKALAILPRAGGGTERVARADGSEQALPDAAIVALAQTAERVAEHFGSPQDIEWARANGELYLLQSRPITSLYPVPANPFADPGLRIYASLNSIQGVTDPLTPFGANLLQILAGNGIVQLLQIPGNPRAFLPFAGGRLFIDMTDLARDPRLRNFVTGVFERGDPGALAAFRRLVAQGRIPLQPTLTRRRAWHLLRRAAPLVWRVFRVLLIPERAAARIMAILEQVVSEERERLSTTKDLAGRLHLLQTGLPRVFVRVITEGAPVLFPVFAGLTIVDGWLQNWLGEEPGTVLRVMRGVPNNVTTEMDLKLWHAAQRIQTDPAAAQAVKELRVSGFTFQFSSGSQNLPPTVRRTLEEFLGKYGMRAAGEIDIGRPRWRDDPTPVLSTLAGYLQLTDPTMAPDAVFARGRAESERLAAELIARTRRTRFGWLRARLLGAAIRRMRLVSGLRELPKFRMVQVLDLYRTALLESARELVARGALERAEDIFFVPLNTLEAFAAGQPLELKSIVRAERASYEREQMRRQLPRLLLSTGEAFYEGVTDTETGKDDLVGDPVSPGMVEGRVQVVLDPRGARLEPGAILVCPATDPGWTPLFLTASGLVMEIGGLITHGSVVAREYGIPAVVGVHNATTRLRTGDRVRVDGNRGRVTVLNEPMANELNGKRGGSVA